MPQPHWRIVSRYLNSFHFFLVGIKEENAFDGISKTQTFSLLKSYNQSIIENIHHADSINSVVPKAKMRHSGSKHKIDYD